MKTHEGAAKGAVLNTEAQKKLYPVENQVIQFLAKLIEKEEKPRESLLAKLIQLMFPKKMC